MMVARTTCKLTSTIQPDPFQETFSPAWLDHACSVVRRTFRHLLLSSKFPRPLSIYHFATIISFLCICFHRISLSLSLISLTLLSFSSSLYLSPIRFLTLISDPLFLIPSFHLPHNLLTSQTLSSSTLSVSFAPLFLHSHLILLLQFTVHVSFAFFMPLSSSLSPHLPFSSITF